MKSMAVCKVFKLILMSLENIHMRNVNVQTVLYPVHTVTLSVLKTSYSTIVTSATTIKVVSSLNISW